MNFGLVKTFDHLPRPHSIKCRFHCGYVGDITNFGAIL
jgi:hypothetical protein